MAEGIKSVQCVSVCVYQQLVGTLTDKPLFLPFVRSSLRIASCMNRMVDTIDPIGTALWPQEYISVLLEIVYQMHSHTGMQYECNE